MEKLEGGKDDITSFVAESLISEARELFKPGSEKAGCEFIEERFQCYRKKMETYDDIFGYFIPGKWQLPIQISLQFCKMTGEQLDRQLTENPQQSKLVLNAKKQCVQFEKELDLSATQWYQTKEVKIAPFPPFLSLSLLVCVAC